MGDVCVVYPVKAVGEQARGDALEALKRAAADGRNVFEALLDAVKVATLGELSDALFEVGGRYRRAM